MVCGASGLELAQAAGRRHPTAAVLGDLALTLSERVDVLERGRSRRIGARPAGLVAQALHILEPVPMVLKRVRPRRRELGDPVLHLLEGASIHPDDVTRGAHIPGDQVEDAGSQIGEAHGALRRR